MANTYVKLVTHYIWSTKKRQPLLLASHRERVWAYLAGIAKENRIFVHEMGGMADHIHALVEVPKTMTVAEAAKRMKGGSSVWINTENFTRGRFEWQDGYGAFTVGFREMDEAKAYIRNQEEHHRVRTFAEEYETFLREHGIEFDPRYHLD